MSETSAALPRHTDDPAESTGPGDPVDEPGAVAVRDDGPVDGARSLEPAGAADRSAVAESAVAESAVPPDADGGDDGDWVGPTDEAPAAPEAPDSQGKAADLFRESEIAADYVEGLLDILDYDGDIDELVSGGRPMVEVVGGRLNALVGTRGATLEALQELARLAVFRQTGTPSRLLLDVGGYRATRRKELGAIAKNAAEKVKEYGEAVRLEPMSAFERKCIHDVINALTGVESESEGVEPSRRIVVRPAS